MTRVFLLTLIASSGLASADCMDDWLRATPSDGALPQTPHLLVTMGGRFGDLDPAKELHFVGPGRTVPVEVVASFTGYRQTIALVRPRGRLFTAKWKLTFTSDSKHRAEPLGSWDVVASDDVTPPAFVAAPALGDLRLKEYGCGPARFVQVKVATTEEAFVEATVTGEGTARVVVLSPKNGVLELGHGMCSGALRLPPKTHFSVTLTPIDLSGNRGMPSAPLSFTSPGDF